MFTFIRRYRGPLQTCILDWSGTTADKYVLAPALAFRQVFEKAGVPITMKEARSPMGLRKDLHIRAIAENKDVEKRWDLTYGRFPQEEDIEQMYNDYIPILKEYLPKYSTLIEGVPSMANTLVDQYNMNIGLTTGFNKEISDLLLENVRRQGFSPDACVAGDDVKHGVRPSPSMIFKNMDILGTMNTDTVVKVDDTVSGINEGLNAGCWTVGVSRYSNYMDIDSLEHEASLSAEEIKMRNKEAKVKLYNAGAHYVINSVQELPLIISAINTRLVRGETSKS